MKAYYRQVHYRAWGLTAHREWARLISSSSSSDLCQPRSSRSCFDTAPEGPELDG